MPDVSGYGLTWLKSYYAAVSLKISYAEPLFTEGLNLI